EVRGMVRVRDVWGSSAGMAEVVGEGGCQGRGLIRHGGMIDWIAKGDRRTPDIMDRNRRRRIASGSGVQPPEIKQFLNQFEQVRTVMRQMARMSIWERIKMLTGMSSAGAFNPGANMIKTKGDTGHRQSAKERAKERSEK